MKKEMRVISQQVAIKHLSLSFVIAECSLLLIPEFPAGHF